MTAPSSFMPPTITRDKSVSAKRVDSKSMVQRQQDFDFISQMKEDRDIQKYSNLKISINPKSSLYSPVFRRFIKCFLGLPTELRDEIYSYLWLEEIDIVHNPKIWAYPQTCNVAYFGQTWFCRPDFLKPSIVGKDFGQFWCRPDFLKPSIVGKDIASDALQWVYFHTVIKIGSYKGIAKYLNWNAYDLGIRPSSQPLCGLSFTVPATAIWERQTLYSKMSPLLSVKLQNNFVLHIEIEIISSWQRAKTFEHYALNLIGKDIQRIVSRIEVSKLDLKVLYGLWDVTHLLGASQEEWKVAIDKWRGDGVSIA